MAPTSRHLLFFIAYALCSIHVAVPKGEPQDEPKGITVNLESQEDNVPLNEKVNLTCKGTGDVLQWQVNGAKLDNNTIAERGIAITHISTTPGNLLSILTITALPMNDRIGIGCQMIKCSTEELKTNSSTLIVLGISPVTGISYDPVTSILSWSGPFFHSKDIPRTADTTYAVKVNGAVVEKNTTDTHVKINKSCDFGIIIKACTAQYCSVASKNESGYIVQDLEIKEYENGSFTIMCVYDVQKTGLGCRVVVTNINSGGNQSFDILLPNNSSQILLASGIYSITVLELINGSISKQSCVPSKQIYVMHPSSTNSDNVNTKGVSTSSTTAITPATSLPTAPRTATSAPAITPIIITAITSATICTALTPTDNTNGSPTSSPNENGKNAEIIAVAIAVVIIAVVIIAVAFFIVYCRKHKLHNAQEVLTVQVTDTSNQSTIAETSFATSSSNEGNSMTVAINQEHRHHEIPPGSSLNGEDCNESRYDSTSQEETTTGSKNSRIVSSPSTVPQESEPLELNEVPVRSENNSIEDELKKFK